MGFVDEASELRTRLLVDLVHPVHLAHVVGGLRHHLVVLFALDVLVALGACVGTVQTLVISSPSARR